MTARRNDGSFRIRGANVRDEPDVVAEEGGRIETTIGGSRHPNTLLNAGGDALLCGASKRK